MPGDGKLKLAVDDFLRFSDCEGVQAGLTALGQAPSEARFPGAVGSRSAQTRWGNREASVPSVRQAAICSQSCNPCESHWAPHSVISPERFISVTEKALRPTTFLARSSAVRAAWMRS